MRSQKKRDSLPDKDESLLILHMSHLNIESSYLQKYLHLAILMSDLAVYFCEMTGCLMSDSQIDSSQVGEW